jgi:hypothetical protein
MRETRISLAELALVGGTRVALGAGLGLLLAGRLSHDQRRAAGWTLFLIGALTTVPLAFELLGGGRLSTQADGRKQTASRPDAAAAGDFRQRGESAHT